MKKKLTLIAVLAITAMLFVSCDKTLKIESIELDKTELTLEVGETEDIDATVVPETDDLTWTSDAEAVATVSSRGKVTAIAEGTANIKVTAGDVSATCVVTVTEGDVAPTEYICLADAAHVFPEDGSVNTWLGNEATGWAAIWIGSEGMVLENYGASVYGKFGGSLTPVKKGTEISTLSLTKNSAHILKGLNYGDGWNSYSAFDGLEGTNYLVFSVYANSEIPEAAYDGDVLTNADAFKAGFKEYVGWIKTWVGDDCVYVTEMKFPATKVGE